MNIILIKIGISIFFLVVVFIFGYYKGYSARDDEVAELKEQIEEQRRKLKKIIKESENYKQNRNKEVARIRQEIKALRTKQGKIRFLTENLYEARKKRNIDNLKQYTDRLAKELKITKR